jgi:hypothetical protein
MGSQFPISKKDRDIYTLLKEHGKTGAQIKTVIETTITKLAILAESARLPGVAKHLATSNWRSFLYYETIQIGKAWSFVD